MVPPLFGARLVQAPFVPTLVNCCQPGPLENRAKQYRIKLVPKKGSPRDIKGRAGGLDDFQRSSVVQAAIIPKNERSTSLQGRPTALPSNGPLFSSLISCVKSASPFWREARVHVRCSSGQPEASMAVREDLLKF